MYNIQKKYIQSNFDAVIKQFNINNDFHIHKNKLYSDVVLSFVGKELGLNLELPKNLFVEDNKFKVISKGLKPKDYSIRLENIDDEIFTHALTRRNYLNYSVMI